MVSKLRPISGPYDLGLVLEEPEKKHRCGVKEKSKAVVKGNGTEKLLFR